jgi:hypothetical protein
MMLQSQIIEDMPKEAPTLFFGENADKFPDAVKWVSEHVQHLVFSDTILLTASWSSDDRITAANTLALLGASVTLARVMFLRGLPVRGAITHGDFLISKTSFVGRPIVAAHELAAELELAATVIDGDTYDKLMTKPDVADALLKCSFKYTVPTKSEPRKCRCLVPTTASEVVAIKDIRQYVLEHFWEHKKDISPSAMLKASNTECFLRYWNMICSADEQKEHPVSK